jgi:perosamine synthetase
MKILLSKPDISNLEINAVTSVLSSSMLASGPKVKELEQNFAKKIGTNYAIAVSSGTTALHAVLLELGIQKGDNIITTPYTFIATSNSILFCNANPIFCDIDENTYNLDPNKVEDILKKKKVKAIILVHLYGLSCDMYAFNYLAKKYNVKIIEDCAQSIGASYKDKMTGSFGYASCFSLYATKNIMCGEGGMICINNKKSNDLIRSLINHGRKDRFTHDKLGYNFRMTDIEAALGIVQLNRLDEFTNKRIKNASYYTENLKNIPWIKVPYEPTMCKHVYHQYAILVPKKIRNKFIEYLNKKNIYAAPIYPLTTPEQPFYKKMGYKTLPMSYDISKRVVCLPVHTKITKEDLTYVVNSIKEFKI